MISWRPVIPEMGTPPSEGLRRDHDVGVYSPMLHGEPFAGAAHAGLDLVGYEQDAVLLADLLDDPQVLGRRHYEAAFALNRLGDDRRYLLGIDLLGEGLLEELGALAAAVRIGESKRAPIAVGVGDAVDLRRVGPEAHLVRAHLGGEAEGHVGAAVEGVVKGDERLPARGIAGDLDGVLDSLGPGVHKERALGKVARRKGIEALGQPEVGLVAEEPEAHVRIEVGLLLDGLDHFGVAMTDIHHADAGREVDVLTALDVGDNRVSSARHVEGRCGRHATRDHLCSQGGKFGVRRHDSSNRVCRGPERPVAISPCAEPERTTRVSCMPAPRGAKPMPVGGPSACAARSAALN